MYKFYDPEGDLLKPNDSNTFIERYNPSYYIDGDNLERSWLNQSCTFVEEEIENILKNGINLSDDRDIRHIISWKIGSVDHEKTKEQHDGKFHYHNDEPGKYRFAKVPLKELYEHIRDNEKCLKEKAHSDNQEDIRWVIEKLREIKGIGDVYAITLLYFLSNGKYPIYDQYAHYAIKAIGASEEEKDKLWTAPDLKKDVKLDSKKLVSTYIDNYVNTLKNIFEKRYNDRNVDRALWVYGHLFNDNKTNRKRVRDWNNK